MEAAEAEPPEEPTPAEEEAEEPAEAAPAEEPPAPSHLLGHPPEIDQSSTVHSSLPSLINCQYPDFIHSVPGITLSASKIGKVSIHFPLEEFQVLCSPVKLQEEMELSFWHFYNKASIWKYRN